MTQGEKEKILKFLQKEHLAVLSYAEKNQPKSAVIDFSESKSLEILFITLTSYRKYKILKKNPKISLCFGGKKNSTVQYEGLAEEISKLSFLPYLKYHIQKNPIELKFSRMLEAKFFKIKPVWVRYSNFKKSPNEIFEVKV